MKLKYYSGDIQACRVCVIASSAKRVHELVQEYDPSISLYYVRGWYSCVPKPPNFMQDKPVKEAIWIQLEQHGPYVLLTKDLVARAY